MRKIYSPLCNWFQFRVIEHGMVIRYPIHPTRYWAFRMGEWDFRKKYYDIVRQMALNHIGEAFQMLDAVAEIAQGENFGEPMWDTNISPKEPVLPMIRHTRI